MMMFVMMMFVVMVLVMMMFVMMMNVFHIFAFFTFDGAKVRISSCNSVANSLFRRVSALKVHHRPL